MSFSPKFFFVSGVTLVVMAAVIAGLVLAGSPAQERMRRADEQRLSDLQQIKYALDLYWARSHQLPDSLETLAKSPDIYLQHIRDPKTGDLYELLYDVGGPDIGNPSPTPTYQLCATFETADHSGQDQIKNITVVGFWQHEIGRTCYALTIDNNEPLPPYSPAPLPPMRAL